MGRTFTGSGVLELIHFDLHAGLVPSESKCVNPCAGKPGEALTEQSLNEFLNESFE